jgi:hypothetical protein
MEKWEYKIVKFYKLGGMFASNAVKEEELNSLGDQGWELVTVDQHPYSWVFKRKKNRY